MNFFTISKRIYHAFIKCGRALHRPYAILLKENGLNEMWSSFDALVQWVPINYMKDYQENNKSLALIIFLTSNLLGTIYFGQTHVLLEIG